jgi:hypothetical protein
MSKDIAERLQSLVGEYIGDADIDDVLLDAKEEIERLREALGLILNANSFPYAQEIASKALSEQDASPCPTNTIK